MKAKKLTKVQQVKNLLAVDPTISIKSVASALGITEAYAGTLLWKAKGGKKSTRNVTPTPKAVKKMGRPVGSSNKTTYREINGAQVMFSTDRDALQAEVIKLNDWCMKWRANYEEAARKLAEANSKYADTRAVIYYLESKIAQLIK